MKYVEVWQETSGIWKCTAKTGNWAGDFFFTEGPDKDKTIRKMIKNIKKDWHDLWLLDDPIFSEYINKKI